MKNIALAAISISILLASCTRYAECTTPHIELNYALDTTGYLLFTFEKYEKGSSFSKLVSSEPDSAYLDTVTSGSSFTRAKHMSVDEKHDYLIKIPATGRTYRISDIQYSGTTKAKDDGTISEMKTACTRTVNYTLNGQLVTVEGSTYRLGSSAPANRAVITIIK